MYVIIYVITTYIYIIQSNAYVCIRMHVYITEFSHALFHQAERSERFGDFLMGNFSQTKGNYSWSPHILFSTKQKELSAQLLLC